LKDVRPMHDKYIEAYSKYADLVLDSNFISRQENQLKAFVSITDNSWFNFLASIPEIDEVNFWQPGGKTLFAGQNSNTKKGLSLTWNIA